MGEVIEKSQPGIIIPQPAIEHTPHHQRIENIEGMIYDTELENTKDMKNNTGFFQTFEDQEHGWMWNGYAIKILDGTEVVINDKNFNITPGIQKVLADTSNIPMKKLNDKDRELFNIILESLDFENYKAIGGESKSVRYKHSKTNFKKHNLKGQGVEKIIIPSNTTDIYTRLEMLLGLKSSGHTDTLTEASDLIGDLYKIGEIQNQQQHRNAPNKFRTQ